jgi:hypothetical protein
MANTQVAISKNGKTTLATAGKYCDKNIDVNVAVASTTDEIPDYVKSEADSLIAKVVSAQGNRVFTLAAITDLHYGNGSYTDGILHASQALSYINKQIVLDAFSVLGDYTDGYPIDDIDNAFGDCRKVNSLLSQMEVVPNLRNQGNHDFYSGYSQFVHYHIQAYNEGVTWGDKNGGYFYRDFADKKLRIVCVNTTETDNAKLFVTDAQYNWFIDALDLSAKSDAADWHILILSHHPLDWYADTYVFCYILEAYKSGGSWSSGSISCNFAGKNAATLIGNIHGHIHNLLTGYINKGNVVTSNPTKVLRICTPEACIGRANQYDGAWKEATTYNKTTNSAKDTSFVVYCIDLNTQNIKAFCYGAGYDREISYAPVAPTVYNITNNLTNCTASGVNTITEGGIATITITANSEYELPDAINVSGASYVWDKLTGAVTLSNPNDNVVISVIAVAVSTNYTNQIPLSINKDGSQYVGTNGEDGYKTGYRLNSSGGETVVTSNTANSVTGFMQCASTSTIRFKNITMNYQNSPAAYVAFYDADFNKIVSILLQSGVETGDKGLIFDANGNLQQVAVDPFVKYYVGSSAAAVKYVRVSADTITASSVITVDEPIGAAYNIVTSLTNCTANGASTIVEEETASVTISANSGYELPDTITVSGANYTWDKYTGTVVLSNPTGNVTVTVVAVVVKPKYTNQIPLSINSDGTQYVGTNGEDGYKIGYRLNSSGGETAVTSNTANSVTGYMECTPTSIIRFKDITLNYNTSPAAYVAVYDADFKVITSQKISSGVQTGDRGLTFDTNGNLQQVSVAAFVKYYGGTSDANYVRVAADTITASSVITVDEEIT